MVRLLESLSVLLKLKLPLVSLPDSVVVAVSDPMLVAVSAPVRSLPLATTLGSLIHKTHSV